MKKVILSGLFILLFSFVTVFAYTVIWSGAMHPVSWQSQTSVHRCSPVSGSAILNYYFTDKGSYDQINSAARNDLCANEAGSQLYVRAFSKDGNGQIVTGTYAGYSQTSYANQGATRGTDYAYMKVYRK